MGGRAAQATFRFEHQARAWLALAPSSAEPPEVLARLLRGRGVPTGHPTEAANGTNRPTTATRVVVIDDDPSARQLLRLVLSDHKRWDIVGEAADGREAIAVARLHQPDLIVLDLHMPNMDGFAALPGLRTASPATAIVIHSGSGPEAFPKGAFGPGVAGFIGKGLDPDRLSDALLEALAG